jgi:hypothetical protein
VDDLKILLIPILSLAIIFIGHIFLFRLFKLSLFKSFFVSFFIGLLVDGILFLQFSNNFTNLSLNIIIFMGLAYVYVDIVSIGNSSIRAKIIELIHQGNGSRSVSHLLESYSSSRIIQLRVLRLIESDQIKKINNKYYLDHNHLQLWLSKFYIFLRKLIFKNGSPQESSDAK